MSDNNTTINVQPILNLQSLHEQLNKEKFTINLGIDSSGLNIQIQSSINQLDLQPAKIPVEADTKSFMDYASTFNSLFTTTNNLRTVGSSVSKSLD